MQDAIVIFVTCADKEQAEKIAQSLIKKKEAACVNVIAGIESIFWWEGRVESADEVLLVIKSKKSKLNQIIVTVKSLHSYEVPEIIALPVIAGDEKYLKWVDDSIR